MRDLNPLSNKHNTHDFGEFCASAERPYTDEVLYVNSNAILEKAYKGNLNIRKVVIGKEVNTIGAEAFSGCFNIDSIIVEPENSYFADYNSNAIIDKKGGILLVGCRTTIIPECVTEIGPFAFCGQTSIEKVFIPSNVKKVSAYAFEGCANVAEIIMEEGVEYLGEYCFLNTTNLETVHFPVSIVDIERNAFGTEFVGGHEEEDCWVDFVGGPKKLSTIYYGGTKSQYNYFRSLLNVPLNLSAKESVVVKCKDEIYGDCQTEPNDEYWLNDIF